VADVARRDGIARPWCSAGDGTRTIKKVGPCFAPVQIAMAAETGEETGKLLAEDDGRLRPVPAARVGLIEIRKSTREAPGPRRA
jgi:transposase